MDKGVAAKFRNYCFTWNNPTPASEAFLKGIAGVKYLVYGREIGESGTPHLQGTIVFNSQRSKLAVIKLLTGCHIEVTKHIIESIAYCKKDGDFFEVGDEPQDQKAQGLPEQERWKRIREAAEEGRRDDIPDDVQFKHARTIDYLYNRALSERKLDDTEQVMLWYYGPSGTGKSRKARTDHPEAYLKMCNKWWDGYRDQEVVLLEDFDKRHEMLVHHLKIWADRYPFPAEVKGGSRVIRPGLIIVTSNYHPREIWGEEESVAPILRRFKCVKFGAIAPTPLPVANLTLQTS